MQTVVRKHQSLIRPAKSHALAPSALSVIEKDAMFADARKRVGRSSSDVPRLKSAGDCRTYRLANTSTKYDRSVSKYIAKMAKQMTAQMKPHTFNFFKSDIDHWLFGELQVGLRYKRGTQRRSHATVLRFYQEDCIYCAKRTAFF